MSRRSLATITAILLTIPLHACEFVDPLYVAESGQGMRLIDAVAGWREDRRIVCVQRADSNAFCRPHSADVVVDGLDHFGQLDARWKPGEPNSVEVFVFGGKVVRCRPLSRAGDVRVALRQLPMASMPSSKGWSPDTTPRMFEGLPNRCTAAG